MTGKTMKIKNILIITLLFTSPYLWAHTGLDYSVPENGATLNESPKQIVLSFTEPAKLVKFELIDSDNNVVTTSFKATFEDHVEYVISVNELSDDQYTILWTIMGSDGHKNEGDFQFSLEQMPEAKRP